MSFAGFKKQLNKANQLLNEKVAGARGTELDSNFIDMDKKIEVAGKMVDDLINRTQEYLQPNPMARARLSAVRGLNNLQNKSRTTAYPQPEGILGECMVKHGSDFGSDTVLGQALIESGDTYKQMAEIKYNLEDNVKQNFLDPFLSLQQRDLADISQRRKKLEGHRLDYDCKKRKVEAGASNRSNDSEVSSAEAKFVQSKNSTESAMVDFLNSDAEHISALYELVAAEAAYHQEAARLLGSLQQQLDVRRSEAINRPKPTHVPARAVSSVSRASSGSSYSGNYQNNTADSSNNGGGGGGGNSDYWRLSTASSSATTGAAANSNNNRTSTASSTITDKRQPACIAQYTFIAENDSELGFEEGEQIRLLEQVDENWFHGELRGKRGYFPINYVRVVVPL